MTLFCANLTAPPALNNTHVVMHILIKMFQFYLKVMTTSCVIVLKK